MMHKKNNIRLLTENEEGYGIISEINTSAGCSGNTLTEVKDNNIIKEFKDLSDNEQSVFMNCILQKCDTQNRNGRYYPREVLEREDTKYQELIKEGRALGASDHPDVTYISLKRSEISHRVVKTWWEGNTIYGVLEILTTQAYHNGLGLFNEADQIADLLRRGVKLGISSRGIGSLKNIRGKNTVQSDFELICYDLVSTPSTPNAFLYPESEIKLKENVNNNINNLLKNNDLEKKLKDFLK